MHAIAMILACLAFMVCGINTQMPHKQRLERSHLEEQVSLLEPPALSLATLQQSLPRRAGEATSPFERPLKALSSFLLAFGSPSVGWQMTGLGRSSRSTNAWTNGGHAGSRPKILSATRSRDSVRLSDAVGDDVSSDPVVSALDLERQSEVLEVLTAVDDMTLMDMDDPQKPYDIVSLGLVRNVEIDAAANTVILGIVLPVDASSAGAADRIAQKCAAILPEKFEWVKNTRLEVVIENAAEQAKDVSDLEQYSKVGESTPPDSKDKEPTKLVAGVGAVGHIVAVASCKGGVGKSTTAVNLAYSLSAAGKRVGIVDLDIYGSSLPTMAKPEGTLQIVSETLLPLQLGGVKLMSMGFLNPGAMPMRGVRVTPIVQQLIGRTAWGELDYLIVDMPPGTGDVQLTLSQDFKVSAAVLVTTPQRLSFVDVVKGVEMFDKVGIPTVAVVENMNGLQLPRLAEEAETLITKHDLSDAAASDFRELLRTTQDIFGEGHVRQLKAMWGINASFSLPILPELAKSADSGVPFVTSAPESDAAAVYAQLAEAVDTEVSALATRQVPQIMYSQDENTVLIANIDGSLQRMSPIELRKRCVSPANRPDDLPADLQPIDFVPMGNYAVSVRWTDGHSSLLPYESFVENYVR